MVMKKAYKLLSRNRKKVWFSAALNMLFLLLLLVAEQKQKEGLVFRRLEHAVPFAAAGCDKTVFRDQR